MKAKTALRRALRLLSIAYLCCLSSVFPPFVFPLELLEIHIRTVIGDRQMWNQGVAWRHFGQIIRQVGRLLRRGGGDRGGFRDRWFYVHYTPSLAPFRRAGAREERESGHSCHAALGGVFWPVFVGWDAPEHPSVRISRIRAEWAGNGTGALRGGVGKAAGMVQVAGGEMYAIQVCRLAESGARVELGGGCESPPLAEAALLAAAFGRGIVLRPALQRLLPAGKFVFAGGGA